VLQLVGVEDNHLDERRSLRARLEPRARSRSCRRIWHLLSDLEARFVDLGAAFHIRRFHPDRQKNNHIRELEALGYRVTLEPAA